MKILYVARHGQHNTDDEGAIASALARLGHTVTCVQESAEGILGRHAAEGGHSHDLLLFHKWYSPETLARFTVPKVFWYFDLVDWPDETVAARCATRKAWMSEVMPLVEVGFCTDGNWVMRHESKLVWLPQGADDRCMTPVEHLASKTTADVLFVGTATQCGRGREDFVAEMRRVWGSRFKHVAGGHYRESFRQLVRRAKVVVAPDAPVTDQYWSNRVYLTLGAGGFLLHPYAEGLTRQYANGREVEFYETREELHDLVGRALVDEGWRRRVAEGGYLRTREEHTYLHRCRQLLATVKAKLGVG